MDSKLVEVVRKAREVGYMWHDIAKVLDISESKLKRLVGCRAKPTIPFENWQPYTDYLQGIVELKPSSTKLTEISDREALKYTINYLSNTEVVVLLNILVSFILNPDIGNKKERTYASKELKVV